MGNIFDISVTLKPDMVTYPGDAPFEKQVYSSLDEGKSANLSRFSLGSHTGTHIDYPLHFFKDGRDSGDLELENVVGDALVLDVTDASKTVDAEVLKNAWPDHDIDRVLLRTANSTNALFEKEHFYTDFIYLGISGAQFLAEKKVKTVGVDYLSVEKYKSDDHAVHKFLLSQNITVIEGLDLSKVSAGQYFLACLPLKIAGSDGAPARAILIKK